MGNTALRLTVAVVVCLPLLSISPVGAADRQLLLVLDGLRPDYVTAQLMPQLSALAERGVFFERHHSIFPTVTRVNSASIATGSHPGTHGLLGNWVYFPTVSQSPLNTADRSQLLSIQAATGELLTAPTLGAALEAAGKDLFVASSGSQGSSYLLDPNREPGTIVHYDYTVPEQLLQSLENEIGEAPAEEIPNLPRHAWALSAYIARGFESPVAILWLSDPDKTTHKHGIGSELSLRSLKGVDDQIGLLVDALELRGELRRTNILVTSDHGFSTHRGGFRLADQVQEAATTLGMPAPTVAGGAVYLVPGSEALIRPLVEILQRNPAVGAIFSRPAQTGSEIGAVPGTLSFDAIEWNHPRAGDLLVSAAWSAIDNQQGWPGSTTHEGTAGHGSSSPFDVHNVLIAAGPDFQRGLRSRLSSSNADLAPTLCRLAGIQCPSTMTGRVLREAMRLAEAEPAPVQDAWTVVVRSGDYRLQGRFSRVDGRRYFDSASVLRLP